MLTPAQTRLTYRGTDCSGGCARAARSRNSSNLADDITSICMEGLIATGQYAKWRLARQDATEVVHAWCVLPALLDARATGRRQGALTREQEGRWCIYIWSSGNAPVSRLGRPVSAKNTVAPRPA
jgi:hypothetical protein